MLKVRLYETHLNINNDVKNIVTLCCVHVVCIYIVGNLNKYKTETETLFQCQLNSILLKPQKQLLYLYNEW